MIVERKLKSFRAFFNPMVRYVLAGTTHRSVDIPFSFHHFAFPIFLSEKHEKRFVIAVVLFSFVTSFSIFFLLLLLARDISSSIHFTHFLFQVFQFLLLLLL